MSAALFSSASAEWGTPQALFDDLQAEFKMELDVAATALNAKLPAFIGPSQDALYADWAPRRCWMNPPYSRGVGAWVKKAYEESQRGALVVCLLPARTDTRWFQTYCLKAEVRFLPGRLYFQRLDGRTPDRSERAPFPAIIVVFRPPVQIPIYPGEMARGRAAAWKRSGVCTPRYVELRATRGAGKSWWLRDNMQRYAFAGEQVLVLLRDRASCARWHACGDARVENVSIWAWRYIDAAPELLNGREYDVVLVDGIDAMPAGWDAALRALASSGVVVTVTRNID